MMKDIYSGWSKDLLMLLFVELVPDNLQLQPKDRMLWLQPSTQNSSAKLAIFNKHQSGKEEITPMIILLESELYYRPARMT